MAYLFDRCWSREELLRRVGSMDQLAGIQQLEATDGMARGSRLLRVWTGSGLTFDVLADRALDISACAFRGIPLAWRSAAGDVAPAFYEPQDLGWLRSFQGGLFVTCGLDQFGAPSQDGSERLGLHGRVGNLPAAQVSYSAGWHDDDYLLQISGEVRQARLFGENLLLRRTISTKLGARSISIRDTVVNQGFEAAPHMLLYHFNLGFPLIDADTQLSLDVERTAPRDAQAAVGLERWSSMEAPTAGYSEQVFCHLPKATPAGISQAAVSNPTLGLGLRISYERAALPYLFQWKMMGEGAYVLGIEPANCNGIEGRTVARRRGDLPYLAPGEGRSYQLEIEIFDCR